ncbi:MAG: hypothetical protein E6J53_09535 [Chloroflexi bacterium]|nr:MAG: hypothetical protein E6J53_09535 [Chloroflexota bacterium]
MASRRCWTRSKRRLNRPRFWLPANPAAWQAGLGDLPGHRVRVRGRPAGRLSLFLASPAAGVDSAPRALIVGGGPAGDAVSAGLRDGAFNGEIVLLGSEPELPYERPHLSKGYLMGTVPRTRLGLRPPEMYRELGIELRLGERCVDLGLERREAVLESGTTVPWDRLCIATGSAARRLPELSDAMYLRELPDAESLRAHIGRGDELDVIGAGFIGCEVAAVAVQKGCHVRVHEALEQPLLRVLGPELGAYLAAVHRSHGVDLHLGVSALPAVDGPLLVAVGSEPRTELAERAGLAVDRGVEVGPAPGLRGRSHDGGQR